MVTSFFANVGTGAGRGIKYLVEKREPEAIVLRGNIEQTIQLIDSLDFKQRYCSGVHRFTESELSEKTKSEIMDSFENVIFSGMEPEQRPPVLWVQHQEKGGTELHFIIPEVEMTTGKKFTPYFHKTDLNLVDSWKNVINYDYGLSDPNDPERRQTLTIPKNLPKSKKEAVKKIDAEITNLVKIGVIKNRDDVMKTLSSAGFEVTRVSKNFISIQAEDWKAPARLKGDFYGEQFTSSEQLRDEIKESRERSKSEAEKRYKLDRERLQSAIKRRTEKHAERYKVAEISSQEPDEAIKSLSATIQTLEYRNNTGYSTEFISSGRDLGADMVEVPGVAENQSKPEPKQANTGKSAGRSAILQRIGRKLSDFQKTAGELQSGIWRLGNKIKSLVGNRYDRIRTALNDWIETTIRAIQAGHDAVRNSDQRLVTASGSIERAEQRANQSLQSSSRAFSRGIKRVKENRADELEQFKQQINLAQYASKLGYDLLKSESSRNSYVMKNAQGDKIVIATAPDGHGIYFSVGDTTDNGSIIDFHQKRTGDNLGQTRKALRQELGISTPERIKAIKSKPRPADHNIEGVIKSFMTMTSATNHPYLTRQRNIPAKILRDPRFENAVKQDRKGNAVFPHYDLNGLSGYELKNTGFTGFSRGGKKSLWHSSNLNSASEIVITESAIDALSHAALNPKRDAAYISISGSMSQDQKALLGGVLAKAENDGQKITVALDNDRAGRAMTQEIHALAKTVKQEIPRAKDWNEDLKASRSMGYSR